MLLLNMPIVPENKAILFLIFCDLERLSLYNREIILAVLLRQKSKTSMTKNRAKIVIFLQKS